MNSAVFLDLSEVVKDRGNLDLLTQNKILSLLYFNFFLPYRNNPEIQSVDFYTTIFGNRIVLNETMSLIREYTKVFNSRYKKNINFRAINKTNLNKEYDIVYAPEKTAEFIERNIAPIKSKAIKTYKHSFHECDKNCQKCKCYQLMKKSENIKPSKFGMYMDFLKPYMVDDKFSRMVIINDYSSSNDLEFHKIFSSDEAVLAIKKSLEDAIEEYSSESGKDIEKVKQVIYKYFANAEVINAVGCTSYDITQSVGNTFSYMDSFANNCSSFVKEELKFINPEMVLALGSKAFAGLGINKQELKYTTAKGKIVDLEEYRLPGKLFTTSSVIDLVKNFSLKQNLNLEIKTFIKHLIDKKYEQQEKLFQEKAKEFVYVNNNELIDKLNKSINNMDYVSIDIETNSLFPYKRKIDPEGPKITLFSLTIVNKDKNIKTYLIPFEFDNTTEFFRVKVKKLIESIISSKSIKKILHNASFDLTFIKNKFGKLDIGGEVHDTMLYTALYSSEFLPGFKSLDYLSAISKLGNYYEPLHKYRDTLIEIHRVLLKNKPEILKDFYTQLFTNIKNKKVTTFEDLLLSFNNKKIINFINLLELKKTEGLSDKINIGNVNISNATALTFLLIKQLNLTKENYKQELLILKDLFNLSLKFPTESQLNKLNEFFDNLNGEDLINKGKLNLLRGSYGSLLPSLYDKIGYSSEIIDLYQIALNKINKNLSINLENNLDNQTNIEQDDNLNTDNNSTDDISTDNVDEADKPRIIDYSDIDIKELIPYAGGDSLSTYYVFTDMMEELKKQPKEELYLWIMRETMKAVVNMQSIGTKIDLDKREVLIKEYKNRISTLTNEITSLAEREIKAIEAKTEKQFNINSLPNVTDLFRLLGIEKVGLATTLRKTAKNKKSMNKETLEKITTIDDQENNSLKRAKIIATKLLEYRELNKLYTTYLDSYNKYISDDGFIHAKFRIDGTSTGRAASSDPNLQNPPKNMKFQYISRYPGGKILNLDYSQLELRVLGWFIKKGALVEAFKADEDIHLSTAKLVSGKEYLCKDILSISSEKQKKYIDIYKQIEQDNTSTDNEILEKIDKLTAYERKKAKTVNFGLIYGQTPWGLAYSLSISKEEAQNFINDYFENIPEVHNYLDSTKRFARDNGYVETLFNSKRYVPTAFYDEVLGADMIKYNKENKKAFYRLKASMERKAINAPIQGTAALVTFLSLIAINDYLKDKKAHMIMTVHDSIVIDVSPEINTNKLIKEVVDIMEKPIDYIVNNLDLKDNLKNQLISISENYKKIVPLKAEAEIGDNYKDISPVEIDRKNNISCIAKV